MLGILAKVLTWLLLAGSWSGLDRFAFILGETVCNNSLHLGGGVASVSEIFLDSWVKIGGLAFQRAIYASKQQMCAIIHL